MSVKPLCLRWTRGYTPLGREECIDADRKSLFGEGVPGFLNSRAFTDAVLAAAESVGRANELSDFFLTINEPLGSTFIGEPGASRVGSRIESAGHSGRFNVEISEPLGGVATGAALGRGSAVVTRVEEEEARFMPESNFSRTNGGFIPLIGAAMFEMLAPRIPDRDRHLHPKSRVSASFRREDTLLVTRTGIALGSLLLPVFPLGAGLGGCKATTSEPAGGMLTPG